MRELAVEIGVRALLFGVFVFTEFLDPFQRVIQPEEIWLYKNPLVQSDNIPTRLMFAISFLTPLAVICVVKIIRQTDKTEIKEAFLGQATTRLLICGFGFGGHVAQCPRLVVGGQLFQPGHRSPPTHVPSSRAGLGWIPLWSQDVLFGAFLTDLEIPSHFKKLSLFLKILQSLPFIPSNPFLTPRGFASSQQTAWLACCLWARRAVDAADQPSHQTPDCYPSGSSGSGHSFPALGLSCICTRLPSLWCPPERPCRCPGVLLRWK
ncbi:phospholipid phosphatase 4 isoform X2 [Pipistrellus kuhlii]|uniref:phospholipid phosphatase 4 isoform X2 n=1 Tax=Pipistrellus kuhlii TaxID=59472 RepID=UPI001E2717AE|nr:phospholipid phosphatase 4 isoform X2 [Pipistrellus kuhlii]